MNVSLKDIKVKYGPIKVQNGMIMETNVIINPHFHDVLMLELIIKCESGMCAFIHGVNVTANLGEVLRTIYRTVVSLEEDGDDPKDLLKTLVKKNVRLVFANEDNPPIAIGHIIDDTYLLADDVVKQ